MANQYAWILHVELTGKVRTKTRKVRPSNNFNIYANHAWLGDDNNNQQETQQLSAAATINNDPDTQIPYDPAHTLTISHSSNHD